MSNEDDQVTLTTKEARQGETSGRVRTILITGIATAIAAMVVLLAMWSQG
jgi:hypothetical protein